MAVQPYMCQNLSESPKTESPRDTAHALNELCCEKNQVFAYGKTKTQIGFAVTAKLISAFVFATRIVQSLYYLNPKFQASDIFYSCTARFVSDLVIIPEDWFSHNEAQMGLVNRIFGMYLISSGNSIGRQNST